MNTCSTRMGRCAIFLAGIFMFCFEPQSRAAQDIIKVMSYNVLKYGNGCQGPNGLYHAYLKTIVGYVSPDILGLVKVSSIQETRGGKGKAPFGFADSILNNALNAAFPGRYACCPFSNSAKDNTISLLFYNKNKFGMARFATLVSDRSDIDVFKLYYKSADLTKRHDTTFLYVILLHTDSGDDSKHRDRQIEELVGVIRKYLPATGNIIVMGDFNLRNTDEKGYQALVSGPDSHFRFADPPFAIDHKVVYPANWDKHPERYSVFLTTSTRKKWHTPNSCGTGGGAKGWYDHILLSPGLASPSGSMHYIAGSYSTIGNDGRRIKASVNDLPNSAAPPGVLNALYNMSNKYPVVVELGINSGK